MAIALKLSGIFAAFFHSTMSAIHFAIIMSFNINVMLFITASIVATLFSYTFSVFIVCAHIDIIDCWVLMLVFYRIFNTAISVVQSYRYNNNFFTLFSVFSK